ncbi:Ribophorin I [Lipomyces chichibuensis]|uniref:Ribophorin I n=1 Tax=Lipomyces chichibuensis TaxID=1546026 RepID=UPI0033442384
MASMIYKALPLYLLLLVVVRSEAAAFVPSSVFEIQNLFRTVDLTKSYLRESASFIIENISEEPQNEYYVAVPSEIVGNATAGHLAIMEVKEKRVDPVVSLAVEVGPFNADLGVQFYKVQLSKPLAAGETSTIQMATATICALEAQPKLIKQPEAQNLLWTGSKLALSPYKVARQRTKVKLSDRGANAYSKSKDDPQVEDTALTYGPYLDSKPFAAETIQVRYEYHFPVVEVTKLERELWVSHSGGNLATEERYWITNSAAKLSETFSRLRWQASGMAGERSTAIKGFSVRLRPGARDVYFTDEIGNVSTSNFRADIRDPVLDFRPRYPIFGGWNYSFTLGWNHDLGRSLKVLSSEDSGSDTYMLRVPLLEGPDNVAYDVAEVSIILPEAANVVDIFSTYRYYEKEESLLKSHLDTIGRTVVRLTLNNIVDEHRRHELYITYTYSSASSLHKPIIVSAAIAAIFFAWIILRRIDVSISK